MQTGGGSANQGGRGNRGIMAEVVAWRHEGQAEKDIRDKLKERNYQGPRITELLKNTRASAAVIGKVAAAPPARGISPAPPVHVSKSEANGRAPCLNYGKVRRAKNRTPNPF